MSESIYNRFMNKLHEEGNFIPPKVQIALIVASLGWFVWATSAIFQLQPSEPRFTRAHAEAENGKMRVEMRQLVTDLYQQIDRRLDLIPVTSTRMDKIEARLREIADTQHELSQKMEALMP